LKCFKGQASAIAGHSVEINVTEFVATMHYYHPCMIREPIEIMEKSKRTSREEMAVYPAVPQKSSSFHYSGVSLRSLSLMKHIYCN
jgi:hypothetical protein